MLRVGAHLLRREVCNDAAISLVFKESFKCVQTLQTGERGYSSRTYTATEENTRLMLCSWGRGESGALGHASDRSEHQPRPMDWEVPESRGPIQVSCGLYHSAVRQGDKVWIWGRGSGGRLGQGDEEWAFAPQELKALEEIAQSEGGLASVCLGGLHSAALTNSGEIYTWGHGGFGALGHGNYKNSLVPKKVIRPWDKRAREIAAGYEAPGTNVTKQEECEVWSSVGCGGAHTLALTTSGLLFAWGRDEGEGRLGLPSNHSTIVLDQAICIPAQVLGSESSPVPPLASVAPAGFHSLALPCDPAAPPLSWGGNANGQLGVGDSPNSWWFQTVRGLEGVQVKEVLASGFFSAALSHQGEVYTWGSGKEGQLGHGDLKSCSAPKKVEALAGEEVVHLALGTTTCYAVTAKGELLAWGSNLKSQMGLGWWSNDEFPEPQLLRLPGKVVGLQAGAEHAIAVLEVAA